ncbi:MAG: NADP-dependent malic enzyme, partial [Paramuribaculum sp.]|nr:NADP-dependent malic enzyme [Paramuribaculum sp.]
EFVGIRPSYNHFATLHVITTKKGTFFIADTQVNKNPDSETLTDIARLTRNAVEYFAETPVMAMVSYANFGAAADKECGKVAEAVKNMQELYPELAIDGEMTINYALNAELRDKVFPFTKLKGKDVNALIFPNLASASTAYRVMLEMGLGDAVGPIQMGLNKPVHFASVFSPVRDIVNIAAIASLDAAVLAQTGGTEDK